MSRCSSERHYYSYSCDVSIFCLFYNVTKNISLTYQIIGRVVQVKIYGSTKNPNYSERTRKKRNDFLIERIIRINQIAFSQNAGDDSNAFLLVEMKLRLDPKTITLIFNGLSSRIQMKKDKQQQQQQQKIRSEAKTMRHSHSRVEVRTII